MVDFNIIFNEKFNIWIFLLASKLVSDDKSYDLDQNPK